MLIQLEAFIDCEIKMDNIGKSKPSYIFRFLLLLLILAKTGKTERLNSYQEGDVTLGGMFPIHLKPCSCMANSSQTHQPDDCQQIFSKGLFLAEAMVYAVRLVNQRGILPFGISLGYNLRDTCNTLDMAVRNALIFVTRRKKRSEESIHGVQQTLGKQTDPFSLNDDIPRSNRSAVIAVVGAGNSELSLAVNSILTLFHIPQVGYATSAAVFSDKTRYKTFLRVLPSDNLQAKAIAQLLAHFNWNYVSLVSSADHYSGPLRESLRKEIQKLGICFANDIVFSYTLPPKKTIEKALMRIRENRKARVVLVFTSEFNANIIFQVAESLNLTGRIWIASDSWSNAASLFNQHSSLLKGSLGIMFAVTPVPQYMVHLRNRLNESVERIQHDPWLKSLNMAIQNEKLTYLINNHIDVNSQSKQNFLLSMKVQSVFARVPYVIDSVFIIANAIRDYCLQLNISSNATKAEKRASCLESIEPRSLLPLLFNRTLRGFDKTLTVDEHGDYSGSYDFFNFQDSGEEGEHGQKNIGIGSYESMSKVLRLNDSVIDLGQGKGKVPRSRCSDTCLPGTHVVKSRSQQAACCWKCKACPAAQISNVTMATVCMECNVDHMPNMNRTQCVYVPLQYLTRVHPWSIFISICSLLCFFLAVFFVWVFIRHRHSPVVRASCFEISLVLLLSISLGFLLPFIMMSKPSQLQCKASAFLFAVLFAVILSLTLAKINRTVLILNNRTASGVFHRKFLLSKRAHFVSVVIVSAIQVSICVAWFFLNPPKPIVSTIVLPDLLRFLHCNSHKNLWFLVSSGFLIVLSIICTVIAFRSRNFPENYNHARFISLAMFTFNVVWITFMGAYYGNPRPGIHQVITHCCAIIFSNLCLMLLTFGPKVYVIFFRPELNNARTFREMNLQHLLGSGAERGRNFSLFSIGTPGRGNVYLMDQCDPNEKAIQTIFIPTHHVQTQTDFKEKPFRRRHKSSLVSRILGRGSKRKTKDITLSSQHKRVWSEGDTPKDRSTRRIPHSRSSPILTHVHLHCQTDTQAKQPLLRNLNSSDGFGLHSIEEAPETPRSIFKKTEKGTSKDSREFESTSTNLYSYFSEEDENNEGVDEDESTANDVKYDDVFTTA